MKFGPVPIVEAEGAILAHSVLAGTLRLRKGHHLRAEDIAELQKAGVAEVVAAVLESGDLTEDEAARRVAAALRTAGVDTRPASTGRVNLHAASAGIFTVNTALVDAVNRIDPSITLATLGLHARVVEGQMVATVKIIPFAVPETVVKEVEAHCGGSEAFAVHAFRPHRFGVIQTVLPGIKDSVLDKTTRLTEARLARSGSRILSESRVNHDASRLAEAIGALRAESDMILAFGASAMSDADDVIPAAIRMAGGTVERVGMPVDPGNLLVLGELGGKPVIGAPGCARSPKENGFDWVLDRLLAGLDVTGDEITAMGVGGLLMEIPTRPQPREPSAKPKDLQVHAIVLAAGRSSRMGGPNKLLAEFAGEPLVRRTVRRVMASRSAGVTVVVGHQAEKLRQAVAGTGVQFAENPDFAAGLSTSLKAGIAAVPPSAAGVLIALGDMPAIATADLDRLIAAFAQSGGRSIVRATHNGKRGNPVILPRALFPEIAQLQGDTGARHIVESSGGDVVDVEIGAAASVDVDTPEAMAEAGGILVE
jgi:molybdenum cofactor cytidylyltransferase